MDLFPYDGRVWRLENESLFVMMDDATFQKHLNAYLESKGIPRLSYLELLEHINLVLDQRYQAVQHLQNPEYWRDCNDINVRIWQQTYTAKT